MELLKYIQTLNHQLRKSLDLTIPEYCIALYIFENVDSKILHFKYDTAFAQNIETLLHISLDEQKTIIKSLIAKMYFENDSNYITRLPCSIFSFSSDDSKFEEIWKLSNKWGNKVLAKSAYKKSVKLYGHDFLVKQLKKYLAHIQITKHSQQHLSTFLNPTTKQFLNEFTNESPKNIPKGTFFK